MPLHDINSEDITEVYSSLSKFMYNIPFEENSDINSETNCGTLTKSFPCICFFTDKRE